MNFSETAADYIAQLSAQGRHSSAHIYRNALRSFNHFMQSESVSFDDVTPDVIKLYERSLTQGGASPNTVSTYLRMLRSIYNRGVDAAQAEHVPRLFRNVYTGIDSRHKRALDADALRRLLYGEVGTPRLRHTQLLARVAFQFYGIPFTDLAHLRLDDIAGNVLSYRRRKTGIAVRIELLPFIRETLESLRAIEHCSPDDTLLFHLLPSDIAFRSSLEHYHRYNTALRTFNRRLKALAHALGITQPVSTYTLRHSWATLAKMQGSPIEAISEMLGHTSIRTTQIYLKGFDLERLTEVNRRNCLFLNEDNGKGIPGNANE